MSATPSVVRRLLDGPGRWHTLVHRGEVGSTNDVAAEALRTGDPPGLVVVADRQRTGRGRRGRRWEDPGAGASLPVSVTLAPPAVVTLVPLAAGLAVLEAVEGMGVAATLKWPNDVLVVRQGGATSKLVGILAEGTPAGLVLGVGINIDLRHGPVPGATSLAEQLGHDVDRWTVLADVLRALDRRLRELDTGRDRVVLDDYRRRCTTLGSEVAVDLAGGGSLTGRAVDLSGGGGLVVATSAGARVEVTAGDVRHVRPTR